MKHVNVKIVFYLNGLFLTSHFSLLHVWNTSLFKICYNEVYLIISTAKSGDWRTLQVDALKNILGNVIPFQHIRITSSCKTYVFLIYTICLRVQVGTESWTVLRFLVNLAIISDQKLQ